MLTFGLSLASVDGPCAEGAEADRSLPASVEWESVRGCWESWVWVGWGVVMPDRSSLAVSRGAGGGRGGLMVALCSVEAGLGLAFVPARVSPTP